MSEARERRPLAVTWDEAREVLVVVLLVAALLHLVAPMLRYADQGRSFAWWDDLYGVLNNVDALTGLMLLGAAVAVCTTPAADIVPRLRWAVYWISVLVVVLGLIAIVNVLSVATPGDAAMLRLSVLAWRPGPAVLLAGTAAWMARRVVLLG